MPPKSHAIVVLGTGGNNGFIKSAVTAYFDALNRSDVPGLVSVFADDGALVGHEMETLTGCGEIRQAFQWIFKNRS